jgi:RsiW-degrading membrane proteinase PrsW (M82 family)
MMELDSVHWRLVAAGAAAAPATATLIYFGTHRAWRHLRELIWISFGLGFSVAIPIAGIASLYAPRIEGIEGIRLQAAAVAFLEASIPEELGKLLVVTCIVLRHEDLRRPADAIVLTVLVGLGFATIENLYYVFSSENWTETAMLRAVTAVPMHGTVGIVMGYFAARWLLAPRIAPFILAAMFLAPTALHGFYDYPVFAIQQLLVVKDALSQPAYTEFQGIFFASIVLSALSALAVFRSVANMPAITDLAPWFHTGGHGDAAVAAAAPAPLRLPRHVG